MRILPAVGILCLALASSLGAQEKAPKRPLLPPTEDSCDAHAYYRLGVELLERNPTQAADAFFWAGRLDPTWPDALYARRLALLMDDPYTLERYRRGDKGLIRSAKIQRIDSLQYRALMLNPFLYRRLEERMFMFYMHFLYEREFREEGDTRSLPPVVIENWIDRYLSREGDDQDRAWAAYVRGDFPRAAKAYADAARDKKAAENSWLHVQRASVFFMTGQLDSARASMGEALKRLRARDEKKLVYVYESKALYEHAIGLTYEMQGNAAAAREAYGRALQEDLSYYPAHVRTGVLALAAGDTAATIAAMELAVQAGPQDASVAYRYAELLLSARRPAEAEARLGTLVAAEPYFAPPYYLLARALEAQGKSADAAAQYRAFLAHTWTADPNRARAEAALRALGV